MKIALIAALMTFAVSSAQIINTNLLDGPNNVVEYGQYNEVHGQDNVLGGNQNDINGNTNNVHGNSNALNGQDNKVNGDRNFVSGEGNLVMGQGNIVLGPEASRQQQQAMEQLIQQRIMDRFAHRNLQAYF